MALTIGIGADHAGKDLKKGARGTSAKNDDVDLVWQMTRAGDEVRLVPTKKRHTWINPVDLQVRKAEEMFIQNIKGGPRLDKAIEIINREKINVHVGQKIFWKQFEPHAGVGEGRVSQQMAWLAQAQLKEQPGLIDYKQEDF